MSQSSWEFPKPFQTECGIIHILESYESFTLQCTCRTGTDILEHDSSNLLLDNIFIVSAHIVFLIVSPLLVTNLNPEIVSLRQDPSYFLSSFQRELLVDSCGDGGGGASKH